MTENSIVRARIDERTKKEAASRAGLLGAMGLIPALTDNHP